ncbi:MAG TPA: IPTL-CTERM sorting domain-containing protein [Thermoanaerobaculia bacterium]|nr:IPTL-CTERM sorting domain-containing protein [Thermoanaerobaculia bacterium]
MSFCIPARVRTALALLLLTIGFAPAASAATFRVFIDSDNNTATGCSSGPYSGIEQILVTTVDSTPQVTAVQQQTCTGSVFGPLTNVGPPNPPWGVGVGNGLDGTDVVETYVPFTPVASLIRLYVTSDNDGVPPNSDTLTTTANGGPVVFNLGFDVSIPTLSEWGLLLLALCLGGAAVVMLRRRQRVAFLLLGLLAIGATAAWAAITLDGQTTDWNGVQPIASDPFGSDPSPDLRALFVRFGAGRLYFRIDTSLNQQPVANDDSATVNEDSGANTIPVLANDTDAEGDSFTVGSVTQPANGTVTIPPGGTAVSYTPNANYCNQPPGTTLDTFTYSLAPGGATATVTVTVTCVDDAPVAVADASTVTEDSGANAVDVLANDTDVDGGPKSVASVTQPANGVVAITGGGMGVSYTPNANYCNSISGPADTFTYTLMPGSSSTTVTMTVTCVDDPPVAVNDSATVTEDDPATAIPVLANDTDIDAGPKSIASVTQPANGVVVITGGGSGLTYAPNANYCNQPPGTTLDTFTYTLAPGGSSATVTVTVTCVDDAPVAVADSATVAEDSGASAIDVLANDTDVDAGAKSVASVTQPANGVVVITGGGTGLTYAPNANYCNQPPGTTLDIFTYTLTPGSSSTTVTVTVTCVDDPPVAVADAATVVEDSGANAINVLANDTDVDAGPKSIASVTQPANGVVAITGGGTGLTYAPNANYCNSVSGPADTFTYTLTPGSSSTTVTVTVTCVDDPPVAVADAATVGEDSGTTAIPVLANDTDLDGGPKTVAAVTQPANGVVAITGGGTGLSYTPNANYCNTPPGTTLDTFSYSLAPGGSTTTVTVSVTCVDDSPVLDLDANDDKGTTGSDFAVTFTEGDAPKLLEDPLDATVTDVDTANLASLTVTITNVLDPGFETLSADVTGTAIVANYVPATGVLTLTGPDTQANFQMVLRKVKYQNTDVDPNPAARVIHFVANDGNSNSNTATSTVTIVAVDTPPTAVADSATVGEDSGTTGIDVLANDTDPDNGPKSVTSVTQPANGMVAITGGGTGVSYTPNANYCNQPPGTTLDTFTYTLTPGSSSATVTVTVTCADDPPVAVADAATVTEDSGANAINVLANDTDVDAGPKSIASVTQPANGVVVITGGGTGLTYAPNANYCNSVSGPADTFTYTLTPGSSSTTVTVTVTCVDDPPVAVADAATVVEDSGANAINVLANDTDVDGGPKSIASVTQPANGVVVITGGGTGLTYAPNADYCNTPPGTTLSTFTYTLTPGSSSTTVTVTVTCVDDPPVAVADAATVVEDSGANAINVLANDTDVDAGPKSIASVTQPANGVVVITGGGTGLTYAPNANYCNQPPGTTLDTFNYTLTPGSSSTTVTVTVTCVEDPPVAVADSATVTEDSGANAINVLANDTDVDAGPKSIASVTQPANGVVVITGGGTGLTYAPNANYCNSVSGPADTFTYTLTPGSSSTTVTVTVTCVDDPPVAVADSATVVEDSGANAINVLANDTDVDGGPKSIASVTQPANGVVLVTGGGTGLTYAPNANYCNSVSGPADTFSYTLTPGSSSTTVTVTVTCVDDPPVAVNDSATVTEDDPATAIPVLANDTDIDGGPKSIALVTQPANGAVVITGGGTGLTYKPNANYCNNPPGTFDTFTYTLTPGSSSATVSVSVTCVNDAPVFATNPITYTTPGNTQLHVAGAMRPGVASVSDPQSALQKSNPSDVDGPGPLQVVANTGSSVNGGSFTIATDGSFSYVPPAGFTGTDSFTYMVTDNGSPAAVATGTINITVGQRVWYIRDLIDANNAAGGDGRSTNAFDSIAAFNAATTNNGDIIFIFEGNTTTVTPLVGSIALKDGQKLWGQGIDLVVPSFGTLVTATNKPRLRSTAASTDVVTVPATAGSRNNVEIRGLDLEATGATSNAVSVTATGANTVSITVSDDTVRGATAKGINLNSGTTGTYTATVQNDTITSTGNGVSATTNAAGTVTVTSSGNTISSAANALDARTAAGAGALQLGFDNNTVQGGGSGIVVDGSAAGTTTITGFANNAVSGNTVGSGILVTTAIFDQTAGGTFQPVSGGVTVIGASGNGVGASGMVLTGVSGDLAFTDLDIFADGGAGLRASGTTPYTGSAGFRIGFPGAMSPVASVTAVGGPAVDLSTVAMNNLIWQLVSSVNSATTGVALNSVTGTFSAATGGIMGSTGTAFQVGGSNATISYAPAINSTTGKGVDLTTNTGSTISFTGTLTLSNGSNTAFNATGGGTVTSTDTSSTLTTTTGTALNVVNTTIGAAGLKFKSISANGAASGIVLNSTGASGSLSVLGTGSAGSGGTVQNTTSHGVSLTSTLSPSFDRMNIQNTAGSGIKGTTVTNFSFTNGSINNSGTGGGTDESNIAFNTSAAGTENNVSGTVTITGNSLTNSRFHGIDILNFNGTLSNVTLTGNTLTSATSAASSLGSGIRLQASGSATTVANITKATLGSNTITNFPTSNGILINCGNPNAAGTGGICGTPATANNISLTGNTIKGQASPNQMGSNAIAVSVTGGNGASRSQANFDISANGTAANPLTNFKGSGIACTVLGMSTATCNVANNVMVANNIVASRCISVGVDRTLAATDTPDLTATITGNNVSACDGNDIFTGALNSNGTARIKVQSNTLAAPLTGNRAGIQVNSGTPTAPGTNTTVCLNISGNTSAGSGVSTGIGLRKEGTVATTNAFGVNAMAATASPGVESFVDGLNPAGGGTLLTSATSGFTNCSLP